MDLKNCLTAKETAAELRVTRSTLAHWRMSGSGPKFIKHSKYVYYDRSELERYKKESAKQYESTAQAKAERKKK